MKTHHCIGLLALALSACATVPVPTGQLTAAEAAVRRADVSRLNDPSPPELKTARSKIGSAREAVARGDMLIATRLAEEAELDANLVTARLEAGKTQFNVDSMKKTNEALRQQALRDSTNVAPIAIPAPIEAPVYQSAPEQSPTGFQ